MPVEIKRKFFLGFFWKSRSIVQLFLEVKKDCWVVFQVGKEFELGFLGRMRCSMIVFYFTVEPGQVGSICHRLRLHVIFRS